MNGYATAEERLAVSPAPTFESGLTLLSHAANLKGLGYGG